MVVGGRKGEEREGECVAMIERNPPKGKPRAPAKSGQHRTVPI